MIQINGLCESPSKSFQIAQVQCPSPTLHILASGEILSPFTQLRRLLGKTPTGHAREIELTSGEPCEAMPGFILAKRNESAALYGKYPPIRGSDELKAVRAKDCSTPARYEYYSDTNARPVAFVFGSI